MAFWLHYWGGFKRRGPGDWALMTDIDEAIQGRKALARKGRYAEICWKEEGFDPYDSDGSTRGGHYFTDQGR